MGVNEVGTDGGANDAVGAGWPLLPPPGMVARITYTPAEIAAMLRVTRRTVYTWITEGRLYGTKYGPKLWRVSKEHLEAFLRASQGAQGATGVESGRIDTPPGLAAKQSGRASKKRRQ